jgi:Ca2+/Na+ antiporter
MTDTTNKTMPKRWSEHRAAAWGAVFAATANAIEQVWSPHVSTAETYAGYVAGHLGELFGAALFGAVIFAAAAAVRNLAVLGRASK